MIFLVDNTPYTLSHIIAGGIQCCPRESTWRRQPEACAWTLPSAPFPLADLNLYLFAAVNGKGDYKNFSDFCEAYHYIIKPESALGRPQRQWDTQKRNQDQTSTKQHSLPPREGRFSSPPV